MNSIGRQRLHHGVPGGIEINPEGEVFFITICCLPRGKNQLAKGDVWSVIDETLKMREAAGDCSVRLVLAMPDHLHGLFAFPGGKSMQRVMSSFKEWVAKRSNVKWQRDFFDHRLRGWESAVEKADYIRMNPERAGLIQVGEVWPFQR